MLTRTSRKSFLPLIGFICLSAVAQDKPQDKTQDQSKTAETTSEGHYYKLTFRVLESGENGAGAAVKVYSVVTCTGEGRRGMIKNGDKVPIVTGSNGKDAQYQYLEIGTEISARSSADANNEFQADVTANISSVIRHDTIENSSEPVIRQSNWNSMVTVPIGKPTIIFSSDNASDKGKTELELTATPIK